MKQGDLVKVRVDNKPEQLGFVVDYNHKYDYDHTSGETWRGTFVPVQVLTNGELIVIPEHRITNL